MNSVVLSPSAEIAYRREQVELARQRSRAARTIPTNIDPPEVWIPKHFYLYDTGDLMTLYPCQVSALQEATRRDPATGQFVYHTVLWSWPKKSAKSSIIAALVDYLCSNVPRSSVKLIANDLKQADSRVGHYLRESIKLSVKADPSRAQIKIKPSGYSIDYPNGSRVEMVPIDPSGEAGGNDDLIVYSELHGWVSKAHQQMWSEMTLSPNKFGKSQRWIDTYAGYSGQSPILERLYNLGVKEGLELEPGSEVYANATAGLLCVWITRHLLPWQLGDTGHRYYEQEASTLLPNEFARLHLNQWVTSTEAFIPPEWWTACQVSPLPAPDKYHEIVVGVDAAVSGDCFGIVAVSRSKDKVIQRYVRKWTPPKGGKLEYSNTEDPDDTEYPEGVLRWLAREYNVIAFGYDPYQLHHLCTTLENENVGFFRAFSQGADRLKADKQLRDVIRDRRFVHDGNPDLTEHVTNANAKTEGDKLRLVKRADHLKIDLAVCASMATDLAFELLPE